MRAHRSAVTGRFVTEQEAAADPDRHMAEAVDNRPPVDITIERMNGGMVKIHLGTPDKPRVLHWFTHPDHGDPHDHAQFGFWSEVKSGSYIEERYRLDGSFDRIHRQKGERFYVEPDAIHRIVELPEGECWTMIEPDPHTGQKSGFYQWRPDGLWHRFHDGDWQRIG